MSGKLLAKTAKIVLDVAEGLEMDVVDV